MIFDAVRNFVKTLIMMCKERRVKG